MKTAIMIILLLAMPVVTHAATLDVDFAGRLREIFNPNEQQLIDEVNIGDMVYGSLTVDTLATPNMLNNGAMNYADGTTSISIVIEGRSYEMQSDPGVVRFLDDYVPPPLPELIVDSFFSNSRLMSGDQEISITLDMYDPTGELLSGNTMASILGIDPGMSAQQGIAVSYTNDPLDLYPDQPPSLHLDFFAWDAYFPGDANGDGVVDAADLNALATHWQGEGSFADGDFTRDGRIDVADLNALAGNWRSSIGGIQQTAVPEPSTATLLLLLLICQQRYILRFRNSANMRPAS